MSMNPADYVTLRDYFERLLHERDKAWTAQLSSAQTALDKAETALTKRLEGMNEFRDTLKDQAGRFVTMDILDAKLTNINNQLKTLDNYRANMEGRLWAISAAVTIINIAMGIAWYALRK
jgi:chromosome segregation ATPase